MMQSVRREVNRSNWTGALPRSGTPARLPRWGPRHPGSVACRGPRRPAPLTRRRAVRAYSAQINHEGTRDTKENLAVLVSFVSFVSFGIVAIHFSRRYMLD